MIQPQSEGQILQLVEQIGMAPGAKKMLTWEFNHAYEAMESGVYVSWKSPQQQEDQCFRLGSSSRCFCGHLFKAHDKTFLKSGRVKNNCNSCDCKAFQFVPRRPEEVGQHWLVRRKGFNINTWGAPCICKHSHLEHKANRPHGCKTCGCSNFISDFACISCDQKWEEHETIYEKEKERQVDRKTIREDYMPLANNPAHQQAVMNELGIDSRTPEQRFLDEMRIEEEKKANGGMLNLELSAGGGGRPQVNLMVNTMKNQRPKQDLSKPERSIQLMQQRGMAGQRPPPNMAIRGQAAAAASLSSQMNQLSLEEAAAQGLGAAAATRQPLRAAKKPVTKK